MNGPDFRSAEVWKKVADDVYSEHLIYAVFEETSGEGEVSMTARLSGTFALKTGAIRVIASDADFIVASNGN